MTNAPYHEREVSAFSTMEKAICPKCGRKHKVRIYYTGRPPLRAFCGFCKMFYNLDEEPTEYAIHGSGAKKL